MKLVLFGDDFRLGVLQGDNVIDASSVGNSIDYHTPQEMMSKLIENFGQYRGALEALSGPGTPVSQVRLRAPLPRPARLVCMAGNYMESGTRTEPGPINAFNKSSSSVIGHGDTVVLPDAPATVFEHEAELGIVIGKKASAIKADQAFDHIFGYVNFIDVSCRGAGPANRDSFFIGKSWDTFGPMGPALVTADEAGDAQNLPIKLWVDGVLRQDYNTNDMAHKIPADAGVDDLDNHPGAGGRHRLRHQPQGPWAAPGRRERRYGDRQLWQAVGQDRRCHEARVGQGDPR